MTVLVAIVEGVVLGTIESNKDGALSFSYDPAWLARPDAIVLSTSMPLSGTVYKQKQISTHLWNLLPENDEVLKRWGTNYKVSPNNAFGLVSKVGEDAPGAAQFIVEERAQEYLGPAEPHIEWISIDEVENRIRILKKDQSALRLNKDVGRISLAGAQAKTALYWDGERWGVPSGRAPNSHILKPQIPNFEGIVENEHLCMTIAALAGLPTANSQVLELSEPVIVVTRYDRLPAAAPGGMMRRVHQEDFCQALTRMPGEKYQEHKDGQGPGIRDCVTLLRRVSSEPDTDVATFIKANILNWYIGGVDAHAKNYSIIIGPDGNRLAPLYDVSSQIPYPEQLGKNSDRLAMKVGDFYEIPRIGLPEWRAMAKACKLDEDQVVAWLHELGEALPQYVSDASKRALIEGLAPNIIEPLRDALLNHIQERHASITTVTFDTPNRSP
jgi:serine/threonine-protein kinase HipA